MTTFSKFFQDHLNTRTCQTFILHTDSCKEHFFKNLFLYSLSCFKYYAPICVLPVLIQIRSMNKEKLIHALKNYTHDSLLSATVGLAISFQICFYRNLFGKFGLRTFVFLPSLVGSFATYLADARLVNIFETSIFECAIETFLLMRRNIVSRSIANSRILQTWLFMLSSAIILHGKQMYNMKGFWLLTPNPKVQQTENTEIQKCQLHSEYTCKHYLLDGMRNYFFMGLSLDILKTLLSKVNLKQDQSKFIGKLKKIRFRSTTLLTTYVGIYRFTHCWLKRTNYVPETLHHLTASFLAGCCYYFYPQSTLFAYALVQTIRTLWSIIQISNADTKNSTLKKLLWFPYTKIIYPLALANMVHLLAFAPRYVSGFGATIGNALTNNYPKLIQRQIMLNQEKLRNLVINGAA